jgi:trehalose 6-phosphate phosphatase
MRNQQQTCYLFQIRNLIPDGFKGKVMEQQFTAKEHLKGIILDMDGVVTDTREFHFLAWKRSFDAFLQRAGRAGDFSRADYENYVDGKNREAGTEAFLEARGLSPSPTECDVLCAEKNEAYLELVRGAESLVFKDAEACLRDWKARNVPVALITASKNAAVVLDRAKLTDTFSVVVDATDAEKLKLRGKPSADCFLEAARRLNLRPDECTIVEDSLAGVAAGIRGGFHEVLGMSRPGQTPPEKLVASGADVVVSDLREVTELPDALAHWNEFELKLRSFEPILFLDFDGTLTDIVGDPGAAELGTKMRTLLGRLSRGLKVTIVSGRDLSDLKGRVALENVFYVGCHGLDMSGPGCFSYCAEEVASSLPELELATMEVTTKLAHFGGVLIERKKYATAVHYRNVSSADEDSVRRTVEELVGRFSRVTLKTGKKVLEIFPKVPRDKGTSFRKILGLLNGPADRCLPIYIGDDDTDEDVFRILGHREIGIRVDATRRVPTWARYTLASPREVYQFLGLLDRQFNGSERRWTRGH